MLRLTLPIGLGLTAISRDYLGLSDVNLRIIFLDLVILLYQ
jgi:hypothetical protein